MPMPAVAVRVNSRQRQALAEAKRSQDGRVVRRAQIVDLARRGTPVARIAALTGYTEEGVRVLKHRWNERGEDALRDAPRPGPPRKADDAYRARLCGLAQRPPTELGYAFCVWTTPRLAEHMAAETGVRISPEHVRRLLRAGNLTWKRPGHTTRNLVDARAYRRGKARIRSLKRGLVVHAPDTNCGFRMRASRPSFHTS